MPEFHSDRRVQFHSLPKLSAKVHTIYHWDNSQNVFAISMCNDCSHLYLFD